MNEWMTTTRLGDEIVFLSPSHHLLSRQKMETTNVCDSKGNTNRKEKEGKRPDLFAEVNDLKQESLSLSLLAP